MAWSVTSRAGRPVQARGPAGWRREAAGWRREAAGARRPAGAGRRPAAARWLLVAALGLLALVELPLAPASLADVRIAPPQATRLYDRHGRLIASFYQENRTSIPADQIPRHVREAVLAVEDSRFYWHPGIDPLAVVRAAVRNLWSGRVVEGGSTITQQLAKNAFLGPERTWRRKLREAWWALQIERRYTKEEILTKYLNQVYFGHGAYGIETAAWVYFGKPARQLDLAEAALLAGLIRNPRAYSPYLHPEAARERRNLVLGLMARQGRISRQEAEAARREPIRLAGLPQRRAPYFTEYVLRQLLERYGERMVYTGGLQVYTTLDLDVQAAAEEALERVLARHGVPPAAGPGGAVQGAIVALDPRTGHILAMVGGRGGDHFNRAVQAVRQPGSAFKVFVYAAALERGYTPETVLVDRPVRYPVGSGGWWAPANHDGQYRGPVTLQQALEQSINTVAVQLLDRIGVEAVAEMAERLGISTLVRSGPRNDLNLALALGGLTRGVTPLEMARAYAALAAGGLLAEPMAILRVVDAQGVVLEAHAPRLRRVLSPEVASALTRMLEGVVQRGTGKAAAIGRLAAGKTGTTEHFTNAWFIGYTPEMAAAVWLGHDAQNRPLIVRGQPLGSWVAAEIWGAFMAEALPPGGPGPRAGSR